MYLPLFYHLLCHLVYARTSYEKQYGVTFTSIVADEVIDQPLERLAFGSCQKIENNPKTIFDSIVRYNPDLFVYTGDIVYAPNGCCTPTCIKKVYEELLRSTIYQEFAKSVKRIEGVYDDHDFGINDGHKTFMHKEQSKKLLMDFLKKPSDHYRRKRLGAYFSILYRDKENPKRTVKLIVLDTRYFRDCYYHCPCLICLWKAKHMSVCIYQRLKNFIFGIGWNHKGDMLGKEQWKWLEGQLYNSEAESHIIVSSIQIFTRYAITESWGLLPEAKTRLVNLMVATQPKNPIFISGDVHYGELFVRDGIVEITSSSLTHSLLENGRKVYRPFALSVYFMKDRFFMLNNFGGIEYEYDKKHDALKWYVRLLDVNGKVVDTVTNDVTMDPRWPYLNLDSKRYSHFKDVLIVKPRGIVFRVVVGFGMFCGLSWMVLIPYIIVCQLIRITEAINKGNKIN
ncbi:calcineurin-like metallo-phosphoesterase superfamily like protein [Babesia gibsoni]|uniref:Calcineurin-like metallo-phosphoesterase superfamily like protein n=1 Tax=Babesia gibsoni TaxID=33632 RepID=A0AAD8LK62_BABGI|nr:calcineurin-like metallo-phosphoesterase superfamily like protein [Babesia gibsoni]